MGELADYLFGKAHLTVDDILAGLYLLRGNRFSWNIVYVAECDGETAGILASYPGREFICREMAIGLGLLKLCGFWDVLRLAVPALSIASGVETYWDEYYLANMAVFPQYQGRGVGSGLLAFMEQKARESGLNKCSLIVDTKNPSARRLYECCRYQVVYTKTYPGPAENSHAGYHRMVKELN
jgi:GNAT superfamily N-acetyltransferase